MQRQMILNRVCLALIALVLITATWPQSALAQSGFTCTYSVQSGDNLSSIAQRYGVKYPEIKAASGISSDTITVGQTLMVPCQAGVPSPTPTQVSVAPVQDPQGTPVSAPPQDCGGCSQAPQKVEWIGRDDLAMLVKGGVIGLDAAAVFVLVNADSPFLPFGDAVAAGYVEVRYGVSTWRAFKVIAVGTVTVGPVVLAVAPGTSVQPTAAATPPAAAPAHPTSVPPTVTPVPAPPTATSVPPTPINATATPSGCGALVIDGVQIVASASHGQPADQIVDGVVKTRRWCNNGNWQ